MSLPVDSLRSFNRFYTRQIGVLGGALYRSRYSLTEARVLYELGTRPEPTATEVGAELGLDPGYLSRLLQGFEKSGLIRRTRSARDGRQRAVALTKKGRDEFAQIDARSDEEAARMLEGLAAPDRDRLVEAMTTIRTLFGSERKSEAPLILRTHKPGDMGWVVYRHAVLYGREYGFGGDFEPLVAEVVTQFLCNFDPARERCWIAERAGEILGSIFLVKDSAKTAKLRLLLVEPSARGQGLGHKLVEECLQFARQAGYKRVQLWTHDILKGARRIYEAAGFHRIGKESHTHFGSKVMGETWELKL